LLEETPLSRTAALDDASHLTRGSTAGSRMARLRC
jgi:hypothetical protein